jgi:hypothetical protein
MNAARDKAHAYNIQTPYFVYGSDFLQPARAAAIAGAHALPAILAKKSGS